MSLIVISEPICFNQESRLINLLFDAGLNVFHLRKPGIDCSRYKKLISEIDDKYHDRIALHQFHHLRRAFPLIKRLHYAEQLRKTNCNGEFDELEGYTLSTSVHQLNDLKELNSFDYTFYGPVFNSISKLGYTGLSKANLMLPDQNRKAKIIGLGGITPQNIQEIKQLGFDGAAVLGTIWRDKTAVIINFKSLLIRYNKNFK
jgi:thiamine-phosphate pyrophosphorylase